MEKEGETFLCWFSFY